MTDELDDRFSDEAKVLARLAPKASLEAVHDAWAHGLSVTVAEGDKIVSIAPDGKKTVVKDLDPLWYEHVSEADHETELEPPID